MRRLRRWPWKRRHRFVRGSNVGGCSGVGGGRGVYSLRGASLSSGVIVRSVCVGGVGGGSGDNVYECVFCGVDAG